MRNERNGNSRKQKKKRRKKKQEKLNENGKHAKLF